MVIVFGKSSRILKIYSDHFTKCEKCNSSDVVYIVHQSYFHFFAIPVFPIIKFVGICCNDCKDSITEVYSKTAGKFADQTKTPLYMYSWIIIILFFVIMGFLNSYVLK
jgi:hypothetical protein